MVMAFILVNTAVGAEKFVKSEIDKHIETREVSIIFGAYDIIVTIYRHSIREVKDVVDQIRKFDNVETTLTMTSPD